MYGISENALLKILTKQEQKSMKNKRKQIIPSIFLCIKAFELDVFRSRDILHKITDLVIDNCNK
jgi:hypothetical protein